MSKDLYSRLKRKHKIIHKSDKTTLEYDKSNKKTDLAKSIIIVFSSLFFFFGAQIIPIVLMVTALRVAGYTSEETKELFTENHAVQFLAILLVSFTIVFSVYKFLQIVKQKPITFLLLNKKPNLTQLAEVIITYGVYLFGLIITIALVGEFTSVDVNQSQELGISDPQSGISLVLVFLSLVVLPAISEEVLFRGYLFNGLKKYSNVIVAYTVTCLLFGIAHLEYDNLNWIAVIDTLIFSVFLIYISQRHKSLYSAMFLHAIKNSVAFFVLFVR